MAVHTTAIIPTAEQPPSPVDAPYVPLSQTKPLAEFEKIKDLYQHNTQDKFFVQRLTERTYWIGGHFYCNIFYVGDKGVLLFDAPEGIPAAHILEAVASVTDLPITAITYSHAHADHLISARGVVEDAEAKGRKMRIIATEKTKNKMALFKSALLPATETVSWPKGSFDFEGKKFEYDGFLYGCHCDDHGVWLLKDEDLAYGADIMNGDQLIFYKFGASEQAWYYRSNIEQLGAHKWKIFVGGHGNVASKKDIDFQLKYLTDLEAATKKAQGAAKFASGEEVAKVNNHAYLMTQWLKDCATLTCDELRPKYGKYYGFESSAPSNAEMLILSSISFR